MNNKSENVLKPKIYFQVFAVNDLFGDTNVHSEQKTFLGEFSDRNEVESTKASYNQGLLFIRFDIVTRWKKF